MDARINAGGYALSGGMLSLTSKLRKETRKLLSWDILAYSLSSQRLSQVVYTKAWGRDLCRRGGFANFAAETSLPAHERIRLHNTHATLDAPP